VTRNGDDDDGYHGRRPGSRPAGDGTARTSSRAFVPPGKTTLVDGLVARRLDPTAHVPGAGRQDTRVDTTAGKPQLRSRATRRRIP
jgi:hypothetical protein